MSVAKESVHELRAADDASLGSDEDLLALEDLDPALNMKMHLVNNVCAQSVPAARTRAGVADVASSGH